jgi:hypothetical protein
MSCVLQNESTNRLSHDQFRKLFKKWQGGLQKSLLVSQGLSAYMGLSIYCYCYMALYTQKQSTQTLLPGLQKSLLVSQGLFAC